MKALIFITCLLHTALAAPQLISFKDGKVGVNFLGYHAEAGLGGGSNGGGLHASAGTPWGQNAAAGLGGNVNGRAAGVLYAGAQATPDVGAGAVLGGDTSQGGYSGAEAYANGKVSSHTRTITADSTQKAHETAYYPQYPFQAETENGNAIQKIRPPKKYHAVDAHDFIQETTDARTQSKHVQQHKPVVAVVSTTTINKTAFATSSNNADINTIAPASKISQRQPLSIDSKDNNSQKYSANNEFTTTLSATSHSSTTPPAFVALSHSSNGDHSNGNIARGVYDNNPTAIIITRERTKLRAHNLKRRRNHQQKRIKANRQRQSSKTIAKVVEQELQQQQQQHQPSTTADLQHPQMLLQQHQHQTRRQLIAPPPPPPPAHESMTRPCDAHKQECKNVNREVRSDVVQSALQIPIGILQSLQQSLGNLGSR